MNRYLALICLLQHFALPAKDRNNSYAKTDENLIVPTFQNIAYGPDPRQVLDLWQAGSAEATPLVFYIHGGGWVQGDKAVVPNLNHYLKAGISVVSINYRFVTQAIDAGVTPPVQWPINDAVRALQFVRWRARDWNLNTQRIAATGDSAGGCTSLYLAFHDDQADPENGDPVARESTRVYCVAVNIAQTSLDPHQMVAWTPNSRYGGHAFGFMPSTQNLLTRDTQFSEFLAAREKLLPWIQSYSPFEHLTPDDPPVYLKYSSVPALGEPSDDPTHTANFGVKLHEKLQALGVEAELVYPGAVGVRHMEIYDFLINKLAPPNR